MLSTFPVQTQESFQGPLYFRETLSRTVTLSQFCASREPQAPMTIATSFLLLSATVRLRITLLRRATSPTTDGQAPSEAAGGVAATVPGTYSSCLTSREGPTPPIGKALGPKKPGAVWVVVASSCQAGASASWA